MLTMHVIYDHPRDYPRWFVVRKWSEKGPELACCLFPTLNEARESIPRGLVCLPRFGADDPVIVEVWV